MKRNPDTYLQWVPRDPSLTGYKNMIALKYTSPNMGTWTIVDVHKNTSEELKQAIVDTFLRSYDIIPSETARILSCCLEKPACIPTTILKKQK